MTAVNGAATQLYTVSLLRRSPPTHSLLSWLSVASPLGFDFREPFQPEISSYTLWVPMAVESVSFIPNTMPFSGNRSMKNALSRPCSRAPTPNFHLTSSIALLQCLKLLPRPLTQPPPAAMLLRASTRRCNDRRPSVPERRYFFRDLGACGAAEGAGCSSACLPPLDGTRTALPDLLSAARMREAADGS